MIKYNDIMVVEGYQELMDLRSELEAVPLFFDWYEDTTITGCVKKSLEEFEIACNRILSSAINVCIAFYVVVNWDGAKVKKLKCNEGYIGKENTLRIFKFGKNASDTIWRNWYKATTYPYDIVIEMTKGMYEKINAPFISMKGGLLPGLPHITVYDDLIEEYTAYLDILQANSEEFKKEVFDLLFRQLMLTKPSK